MGVTTAFYLTDLPGVHYFACNFLYFIIYIRKRYQKGIIWMISYKNPDKLITAGFNCPPELNERLSDLVELRFVGKMTIKYIGKALDVSKYTGN